MPSTPDFVFGVAQVLHQKPDLGFPRSGAIASTSAVMSRHKRLRRSQILSGLDHDAVERTDDFAGTIGDWDRFAPSIGFGNAKRVLSQDVCSDVLGSADRQ